MTQDAPTRRAPATTAALLCAVVLAGAAPGGVVAADPRPGPAEAAERLPGSVAGLYREATRASARYDKARRKAAGQRAVVARTQWAVSRGKKRLAMLHGRLGSVARLQYQQGGWAPGTQLMLTRSPDHLLDRLHAQRQGEHAFKRLLRATKTTQRRLERDRASGRAELRRLKRDAARQRAAKHVIERRLRAARQKVRERAEARAAAAVGPITRAAESMPVSGPGGCPFSDPPPRSRAGSGRGWVAPVEDYVLSAGFASSGSRWASGHTGQDFAVDTGTPVRSVGPGVVVSTGCGDAFGNQIVVRHHDGYYTQYAHLSRLQAGQGEKVDAGQRLGLSGNTGNSTGPHLHFEARVTPEMGSGVDPLPWLRERGVRV
ncbi:peptidoglycan DD-metalloendopeptidase family protein [Streptomyces iconiensis]|uniref:Peptidoglycan DD-metalloendopeptidase family protein n=1 Tax=Streptomyces iconiensis TaxID=1384038 RepID=A0ABT7A164_9ACTN|nr:peptidoglycan DD-metalloendopeptidase family protein [Streptomyces iconiensis]MDJ1134353.1 peptidoglycan DD-metalloendopeptidase family protein [Streptomyces iconiensis]